MKECEIQRSSITLSELREMEIIDIGNGKRLGFIGDILFDEEFTKIEGLIIPSQNSLFSIFKKKEDICIKWHQVRVIGIDIILVDLTAKNAIVE